MEYLYKALMRDVGVAEAGVAELDQAEPERSSVALIEEQRSEPVAASIDTVAPVSVGQIKSVPFPVHTERLFAMRNACMDKEHVYALEQHRVLRSRVLEIMRMHQMHTLMVTSATGGECKTTTSINLALALSQVQGLRVLLVDTDLRKAGIAEVLGIPYEEGLQDYLHSSVPLTDVLLQLTSSLFFIPSGGVDESSAELLHSSEMTALVKQVRNSFDIVVFDAPPLFPIADARVTANLVDAVLFCVQEGKTSEAIVSEAVALIRPKLIGTVLAGAKVRPGGSYYYYSGAHGKD